MTSSARLKTDLSKTSAQGRRFGIVVSRYHEEIAKTLLEGALSTLKSLGADPEDLRTVWVPGAFEIPVAARVLVQHDKLDAVICLGAIIKGETRHDRHIADEVAHGIAQLGHQTGMPVIFGILTTDTIEQAKARAGGSRGHKGMEAAEAAVAMIQTLESIQKGSKKNPGSVGF